MDPDEILALLKPMRVFLPTLDFSPAGGWLPGVEMNTISMLKEATERLSRTPKLFHLFIFRAFTLKLVVSYLNPSLGLHHPFAKAEVETPCIAATRKTCPALPGRLWHQKRSRMTLQEGFLRVKFLTFCRHKGLCDSHDSCGKCSCGHQ